MCLTLDSWQQLLCDVLSAFCVSKFSMCSCNRWCLVILSFFRSTALDCRKYSVRNLGIECYKPGRLTSSIYHWMVHNKMTTKNKLHIHTHTILLLPTHFHLSHTSVLKIIGKMKTHANESIESIRQEQSFGSAERNGMNEKNKRQQIDETFYCFLFAVTATQRFEQSFLCTHFPSIHMSSPMIINRTWKQTNAVIANDCDSGRW